MTARTLTASDRYDGETEDFIVADTVRSHPRPGSNSNGAIVTAFHQTQDPISEEGMTPALGKTSIGMGVHEAAGVRRLTPVECSRLQGFPDTWLELEYPYGTETEAHAAQVLRRLWREAGAEAGEGWRPGILASLLDPTILLAGVHGGWIPWPMAYRRAASGREIQGADTWPEATLRRLWEYAQRGPSPYGREPFEQLARELGRSLSQVPPSEASAVTALLRSRLWPEASAQWPMRHARPASETGRSTGHSGTAAPKPLSPDSRRYAAMGDAVTVNVAYWIGRRLATAIS